MEIPSTTRCFGVEGPLLIDKSARESEHSAKPFRMIPSHDERSGTTRASAHSRTAFRIAGDFHFVILLYKGKNFVLDELSKEARHIIVLFTPFMTLSITATILDHDCNQCRNALLGDKVIKDSGQVHIWLTKTGAVMGDEQRCCSAGLILSGNINRDSTFVIDVMSFNDESLWVLGIGCTKNFTGDAWVEELAIFGIHHKLLDLTLGYASDGFGFGCSYIFRANKKIAIDINRWVSAWLAIEPGELWSAGGIERSSWNPWAFLFLGRLFGSFGCICTLQTGGLNQACQHNEWQNAESCD